MQENRFCMMITIKSGNKYVIEDIKFALDVWGEIVNVDFTVSMP